MTAIPMTENNRGLAKAVHGRINADGVMLKARASLWRLGGVGIIILSLGAAVGLAELGYSYINDDQALADRMATSFAKALEQAKIPPLTGTVEMTPGTVTMPQPGEVEMKKPGKVELASGGKVEVSGTVKGDTMRPTPQQLTGTNPDTNDKNKAVTNFTIFKFVNFGSGQVVTGWKFSSNEQIAPDRQFCYYDPEPNADITQMIHLVRANGTYTATAQQDGGAALAKCVWFNGQPPAR